jgi:hypothetical protein
VPGVLAVALYHEQRFSITVALVVDINIANLYGGHVTASLFLDIALTILHYPGNQWIGIT